LQTVDTFLLAAYRKVSKCSRMVTSPMTSSMTSQCQKAFSSTIPVGIRPSFNIIIYCIVRLHFLHG